MHPGKKWVSTVWFNNMALRFVGKMHFYKNWITLRNLKQPSLPELPYCKIANNCYLYRDNYRGCKGWPRNSCMSSGWNFATQHQSRLAARTKLEETNRMSELEIKVPQKGPRGWKGPPFIVAFAASSSFMTSLENSYFELPFWPPPPQKNPPFLAK